MDLPKKAEYPDYYEAIPLPMSFKMIRERMESGKYDKDYSKFEADLFLMCNNSCAYNSEGSSYFKLAFNLKMAYLDLRRDMIRARQTASPVMDKNMSPNMIHLKPAVGYKDEGTPQTPSTGVPTPPASAAKLPRSPSEPLIDSISIFAGNDLLCKLEPTITVKSFCVHLPPRKQFRVNVVKRPFSTLQSTTKTQGNQTSIQMNVVPMGKEESQGQQYLLLLIQDQ